MMNVYVCLGGETCSYATGDDVLTQLSFSVDNLWPCVYYLVIINVSSIHLRVSY
jgi:hypothetical protein